MDVKIIWPKPVVKDTSPSSLITFGLKPNPTINKSEVIPIFEKSSTVSVEDRTLKNEGPTINHVIIYPIISGCLKSLIIVETTNAIKRITLISKKTSIY